VFQPCTGLICVQHLSSQYMMYHHHHAGHHHYYYYMALFFSPSAFRAHRHIPSVSHLRRHHAHCIRDLDQIPFVLGFQGLEHFEKQQSLLGTDLLFLHMMRGIVFTRCCAYVTVKARALRQCHNHTHMIHTFDYIHT
jgi:hypothetical protein